METTTEQIERWDREKKERRLHLNKLYPNNKIQKLDIETLRKIGYAIGIGSTDTKKELIDRIMRKQSKEFNPIIKTDKVIGELYFNQNVRLMEYIIKS